MTSGRGQFDPRMLDRLSEAPKWQPGMAMPRMGAGRDPIIDTPLPPGVEDRIRQLQRGQPHQVMPAPQPPAPAPMRSVLRRE
jgi:hypothetical protein